MSAGAAVTAPAAAAPAAGFTAAAAWMADAGADADAERRFGGLRRLYGDAGYARLRAARVAVVGLGGVGSWTVEALARSGVAVLVLVDLDHVAESNVNRQVQATSATLGQAKAQALAERVALIHPGCEVACVEAFVEPGNWPALLPHPVDLLVDACDQVRAKAALAAWALAAGVPAVTVGAAGGKRLPQRVEVADLAEVTHDPLLASLRQRLRQQARRERLLEQEPPGSRPYRAEADGAPAPARHTARLGLRCVFSREPVQRPAACGPGFDSTLNCAGYGSSVAVTATFGMTAAAVALELLLAHPGAAGAPAAGVY
jgi:tRNA A37 threonylcarbamoyladenosine dehydratase